MGAAWTGIILLALLTISIHKSVSKATNGNKRTNLLTSQEWKAAANFSPAMEFKANSNPKQRRFDDLTIKNETSRTFVRNRSWPSPKIPYTLSDTLNDADRIQVARAFLDYKTKTCIEFVPKEANDTDYVDIIRNDDHCGVANLCRTGGRQEAVFGSYCVHSSTLIHELAHTLCMGHEMDRYDSHDYLTFNNCESANYDLNWWHQPSFFDYFSTTHYEGCWPDTCLTAKQPNVEFCGLQAGLSVLDAEKLNAQYQCPGCLSYRFKWANETTPADNPVIGGYSASWEPIHICRVYVNGEIVIGKARLSVMACDAPYNNSVHMFRGDSHTIEILTNPYNANLNWKSTSKGLPIPNWEH